MANTILDKYIEKQEEIKSQILANSLPMDTLTVMQEVNYRIYVLKTCQAFTKTAPETSDTNVLSYHYQLVKAFIGALTSERKFGLHTDDEGQKKRITACKSLETVFMDNCRRFQSFVPTTQDHYKRSIMNMINTVLPVWLQFRNTYVQVDI